MLRSRNFSVCRVSLLRAKFFSIPVLGENGNSVSAGRPQSFEAVIKQGRGEGRYDVEGLRAVLLGTGGELRQWENPLSSKRCSGHVHHGRCGRGHGPAGGASTSSGRLAWGDIVSAAAKISACPPSTSVWAPRAACCRQPPLLVSPAARRRATSGRSVCPTWPGRP